LLFYAKEFPLLKHPFSKKIFAIWNKWNKPSKPNCSKKHHHHHRHHQQQNNNNITTKQNKTTKTAITKDGVQRDSFIF